VTLEGWGDGLAVLAAVLFFVALPAYVLGKQRGFEEGRRREGDLQARMRADEDEWEEYRRANPEQAAEDDRRFQEVWGKGEEKGSGRS
jgi:hypothetical protein